MPEKRFIQDKLTPLSPEQAITATTEAYGRVFGRYPRPETLAILVAHTALECDQWKSLHRYNLGNIKGPHPRTGLYTMFRCSEIIGGREVWFDPPHKQTIFRAWLTAADAFEDYLRFLMTDTTPHNGRPNKWQRAADAAHRGDLGGFVFCLADPDGDGDRRGGYFTASAHLYYDGRDGDGGKPGMLALYEQLLPGCYAHLGIAMPPEPEAWSDDDNDHEGCD